MSKKNETVNSSYLSDIERLRDCEMEEFANEHNITIDQLILDMVNAGWTQGLDEQYNYEYWK